MTAAPRRNRAIENKKAVLRVLRGAAAPLPTSEIAKQVTLVESVVREHLRTLESEGRATRVLMPKQRGNSVRWVAITEAPARARVIQFLDDLEESMRAGVACTDLKGLVATRKLISHLEERLAVNQGARPLFPGAAE